jgi:hypothetical protein
MSKFIGIAATSPDFNGVRYLAHVPGVGFCFIQSDEECFERRLCAYNSETVYDQNALKNTVEHQRSLYPQHEIKTFDVGSLEVSNG